MQENKNKIVTKSSTSVITSNNNDAIQKEIQLLKSCCGDCKNGKEGKCNNNIEHHHNVSNTEINN